jgi:hypothetical protein
MNTLLVTHEKNSLLFLKKKMKIPDPNTNIKTTAKYIPNIMECMYKFLKIN